MTRLHHMSVDPAIRFPGESDEYRLPRWAAELLFAPGEEGEEARHVDSIWPIWNVLDLTPGGCISGRDETA